MFQARVVGALDTESESKTGSLIEQPAAAHPLISNEMGSTDSGNAHSGVPSCGLVSSLLPNSCRGRAESFARRLHRKLTSLGSDANSTESEECALTNNATETSWLHNPTTQRITTSAPTNSATSLTSLLPNEDYVHESQPRHSPESDIYYDFDFEDNGSADTDSPEEVANPADLENIVVNSEVVKSIHHEVCHSTSGGPRPPDSSQESESGCVFGSPILGGSPDTDNSEVYFDPESSGTEKSRDNFFDPQGTSESETASNISNNPGRNHPGRTKIAAISRKPKEDTSESSCSSICNPLTLKNIPVSQETAESSEESLNGKSSPETTSPSHESLWSTFDDSTMSLQDETPAIGTRLPKSHSDSEIPANSTGDVDVVDFGRENGESSGIDKFIDSPAGSRSDCSTYSSSIDIPRALIVECPTGKRIEIGKENLKNEVDIRIDDENASAEMSRLMERLACSPNIDGIFVENSKINDEDDEEENQVEERTVAEDENDWPRRVRRCSSLKSGKTPPGTPGRKKIVRFADVLGLDLVDVRTFLDEIPKIPNSAYSDLIYDDSFQKDSSPTNFWGTGPADFTTPLYAAALPKVSPGYKLDKVLMPLFQQPGGLPNFLDLVRDRKVCLENIVVQDPLTMCLAGTVRVRNLDFHKSVHVRYTLDSWKNFSDLQASYATNSCDGFSDMFTFVLYCHTLKVGQRLELAVRFQCQGAQYWDNNCGMNYCFQCLPASSSGYIPITAPMENQTYNHNASHHEWSPNFY